MATDGQDRLTRRILSGQSDANIRFDELRTFLQRLGFSERINGGHFVYRMSGVRPINLQRFGSQAKAYQVRQVRKVLRDYGLLGGS